eukprot:GILK01007626.1.p1 GENE.GILK01007626.1~~GILK01007626.1.p1  ORF type:complete len:122 (-),score=12.83 GILK01007626.1:103-426(-)
MASSIVHAFKQQKRPSRTSSNNKPAESPKHHIQHVVDTSHASYWGVEEEEAQLRLFDMDMKYGPCIGITRLERWEQAKELGLDPPQSIHELILKSEKKTCLWDKDEL